MLKEEIHCRNYYIINPTKIQRHERLKAVCQQSFNDSVKQLDLKYTKGLRESKNCCFHQRLQESINRQVVKLDRSAVLEEKKKLEKESALHNRVKAMTENSLGQLDSSLGLQNSQSRKRTWLDPGRVIHKFKQFDGNYETYEDTGLVEEIRNEVRIKQRI